MNAAFGTDRYLILVNSSETTVELEIEGLPTEYLVADLFGGSSEPAFAPTMSVTMNAIDVLALRISRLSPIDFNQDGTIDCADVDSLVAEVAAETNNDFFDLTDDGAVNLDDLNRWLIDAGEFNTGENAYYPPGDANLDGESDAEDLAIWNDHAFTAVAAWCSADFNADGLVDGSDFNIWHENKSSLNANAVPEPTGRLLMLAAMFWIAGAGISSRNAARIDRPRQSFSLSRINILPCGLKTLRELLSHC